ncbi:MAG TPA: hypothetical protein VHY79_16910 [Rhizomicrobium sp.]|jgi:hypothetical protein|nr:hypothetical protein [Rhizomicrobium sp.]
MMNDAAVRKCPKCGAHLAAERLDHGLTGQERLFCPKHGEVGSLRQARAHDYPDHGPDPGEYE